MSFATVSEVMGRIKLATEESPIAVFTTPEPDKLDAIYFKTVEAAQRIKLRKPKLVGVYFKDMTLPVVIGTREIRIELSNAL